MDEETIKREQAVIAKIDPELLAKGKGKTVITIEMKEVQGRNGIDVDSRAYLGVEPIMGPDGQGEPYHLGQISSDEGWARDDMLNHFQDRWDKLFPDGWELSFEPMLTIGQQHADEVKKLIKDSLMYLGDGLYAKFDGYHVILMANDPNRPTDTVALDPATLTAFMLYCQKLGWEMPA